MTDLLALEGNRVIPRRDGLIVAEWFKNPEEIPSSRLKARFRVDAERPPCVAFRTHGEGRQ